jgi:hypothetical protein
MNKRGTATASNPSKETGGELVADGENKSAKVGSIDHIEGDASLM